MADDSNKNFSKLLSEVLGDYKSTELDKIIHNDKSFIAVGHIDGNDLGKKVGKNRGEAIKSFKKILIMVCK